MQLKIHWFTVTIKERNLEYGLALWDGWFAPYLGDMQSSGHGGQGFRNIYKSLVSARLYGNPSSMIEGEVETQYFHFELPGQACDSIPDRVFREFMMELQRHEKFHLTRLDLAWDGVPFTPLQVQKAVENNFMRSHAQRKTVTLHQNPWELREDGHMGTQSFSMGSNSSERMLRVYDKHGPVRLELQTRHKRATMIANEVLIHPVEQWAELAIAHLRDYIDFLEPDSGILLSWWEEFVKEIGRAMKTVTDTRSAELDRMVGWILNQVAPTLSVLADVIGEQSIEAFIIDGRRKRGKRFKEILSLANTRSIDIE